MSRRILSFDLLRGWCLIVIACDHVNLHPSIFDAITGKSQLWVTAAEGFFFISGLLAALIRQREAERHGFEQAAAKLWSRAAKLYVATVVLTLLFSYIAYFLTGHNIEGSKTGLVEFSSFWQLLTSAMTFNYVYGWTDFLHYYAVYLVLAPLGLLLLRQRRWWLVLGLSSFFWIFKNYTGDTNLHSYLIWQFYFFSGMVVGFHFDAITAYWRRLELSTRRRIRWTTVGLTVITIVASEAATFWASITQTHAGIIGRLGATSLFTAVAATLNAVTGQPWYNLTFQDNRGGLIRPLFFLLWFGALFIVTRRYEDRIIKYLGGLLIPLGENSLYVYIIQGALVFAVPFFHAPLELLINTVIEALVIFVAWFLVKRRFLFRIIPR